MKTSPNGINLIKQFEGCALKAYLCPAGVWTIGYGHTGNVEKGDVITQFQADTLLVIDLQRFEKVINTEVIPKCELNQNEFDALISFIFNIGTGNFKSSTLYRKLCKGDKQGAADEFDKWIYAGKQKLAGLIKRRAAEKLLFTRPTLGQALKDYL